MSQKILSMLFTLASLAALAGDNPWIPESGRHVRGTFAPASSVLAAFPGATPVVRNLNGIWKCSVPVCSAAPFADELGAEAAFKDAGFDDAAWPDRAVPLNWNKTFLREAWNKQKPYVSAWYRRTFDLKPEELSGRRFFLRFEAVGWDAAIYVNGEPAGRHRADFVPFDVEATRLLRPGENVLAVRVRWDVAKYAAPPIAITHASGCQWWYQHIRGGLWEDVSLVSTPEISVRRLLANTRLSKNLAEFDYVVDNASGKPVKVDATLGVTSANAAEAGKAFGTAALKLELQPGENKGTLTVPVDPATPRWDIGKPNLLFGTLSLAAGGKVLSADTVRFGLREFVVKDGRFHLNGHRTYLFGQTCASVDWAGQGEDAASVDKRAEKEVLMYLDSGCNFVRTAHEPVTRAYLDIADECGLPIFHEWAWSFSSKIDPVLFRASSLEGVPQYVYGSYNHPSVVAWSLGNEVNVHENPALSDLADELVRLVRNIDRQGRPVSSSSGAGGGFSGDVPVDTDILDFHDYASCSSPWSDILGAIDRLSERNAKKYGIGKAASLPIIGMEMLGFSWCGSRDPDFKKGDRSEYQRFLDRKVDWGGGRGAGLIGAAPLDKVVAEGFLDWVWNYYGRRVFEESRLHPRMQGFSPWNAGIVASQSTVWTQPVLPAIRNAAKLNPRNLFSGEASDWTAFVNNTSRDDLGPVHINLFLQRTDAEDTALGVPVPLGTAPIGAVKTGETASAPLRLQIPADARGTYRLGMELDVGGKTVGKNWYDVFIASRAEAAAPVTVGRPVFVLDAGNAKNVARLLGVLQGFGIATRTVKSADEASDKSLLIVPPDYDGGQTFFGAKKNVSDFVSMRGGTLLVMEQHGLGSALPASQQLFLADANFTDLVFPAHPVFKGLSWAQFETWNNPDHGYVATAYLSPFRWENSLAVKGPQLSSGAKFGTVVFEGTSGEGRYLISLLEAVKCAKDDSAAATYLRNLIAYAAGADYCADAKPVSGGKPLFTGRSDDVVMIDLRSAANAGFADKTPADDKQGGWLDQGDNDFRNIATGPRTLKGIPFDIIDPAANGDRSCLRVAGRARPYFPASVTGIPVKGTFDCLYFLHTAGFVSRKGGNAGVYRMHYADGTAADFSIDADANIADWWTARDCPEAPLGLIVRSGLGANVGAYIAAWENPNPEKEIVSFDFISAAARRGGGNAWEVTDDPVPVLLAVSGVKQGRLPSAAALPEYSISSGKAYRKMSAAINGGGTVNPIVDGEDHGMEIHYPAHAKDSGDKDGFVIAFFAPPPPETKFKEFVFQARCAENTVLTLVFPEKGWKRQKSLEATVSGGGDWQEVRVDISGADWNGYKLDWGNLLGELFIYNKSKHFTGDTYPAVTVSVKNMRFVPNPDRSGTGR